MLTKSFGNVTRFSNINSLTRRVFTSNNIDTRIVVAVYSMLNPTANRVPVVVYDINTTLCIERFESTSLPMVRND